MNEDWVARLEKLNEEALRRLSTIITPWFDTRQFKRTPMPDVFLKAFGEEE